VALVVEALDGRLFDGPVHPLDLPVGPRMVRFGEPVLDAILLADHVEAHLTRPGGVAVAGLLGELDAIIGQDGMDAVSLLSRLKSVRSKRGPAQRSRSATSSKASSLRLHG